MTSFPKLLKDAFIRGSQVCFSIDAKDLTDEDIIEYNKWKGKMGIEVLNVFQLRKLYKNGQFRSDITRLFDRQDYLKSRR